VADELVEVFGEEVNRVFARWAVALALAANIIGNELIALAEGRDLHRPHAGIAREAMREEQRLSGTMNFVI
jgi:hypothetical protein